MADAPDASEERSSVMLRMAAALSRVATPAEIATVVTDQMAPALGASAIAIARLSASRDALELGRYAGYGREVMDRYAHIALEVPLPVTDAIRTREGVFICDNAEMRRRYPQVPIEDLQNACRAALPLTRDGVVLGALLLSFPEERRFDAAEREGLTAVADLLAQALGRADLYEEAQRARDAAETASRARLDLLAIVSHDLRNPLGSILTGAALIDKLTIPAPEAEKLTKYSSIIRRAAERMNRWISDLLELAVIEGGELPLVRAPVDATALIKDGVDGFGPMAAEKGIRLDCTIHRDPGAVHVDREQILRVFSNLIGNALKFTPEGGEILISADEVDGVPAFAVRDTGPGIPPEQLEKIFDRYWQARRRRGAGAGLGLSIARGLVEAHGGTLDVESTPGAGATFTFRLPRT